MKTTIFKSDQRLAFGRVPYAWTRNDWLTSRRLRLQGQQTRDAGWAAAAIAVDASHAARLPVTAAARVGPTRRQRAAENSWENEGGMTQPPAPLVTASASNKANTAH